MIEDFLKDNELYLTFLGIKNEDVPVKNNKVNLQELYKIVERQFRLKARTLHPDFGGNQKDFQFLLKCKQAIFEHEEKEKLIALSYNTNVGGFDKNQIASQIGSQIFELISEWSLEIGLKPIRKPKNAEDDNEWLFNISNTEKQLSLNVQSLSDELLELSQSRYSDESMNVLVCLFVPSKKLTTVKNSFDNSTTLKFNDLILIETTNFKHLTEYLSSSKKLAEDLENIRKNIFTSRENELKVLESKTAKEQDKRIFDKLSEMKLFSTTYNENAADFIDKL